MDRNAITKLLKDMYDVRSGWLHHAEQNKFEMNDLHKLQRAVHSLLIVLIQKSQTHTDKQSILSEIDDAIIEAYP